jgi:hypothetical protein
MEIHMWGKRGQYSAGTNQNNRPEPQYGCWPWAVYKVDGYNRA